jgi:hypothetical protein
MWEAAQSYAGTVRIPGCSRVASRGQVLAASQRNLDSLAQASKCTRELFTF